METKYLLVKIYDDWADEISTEGFIVTTQKEHDDFVKAVEEYFKTEDEYTYCIGTNEDITHTSANSVLRCMSVSEITKAQHKSLSSLFGCGFGITGLYDF